MMRYFIFLATFCVSCASIQEEMICIDGKLVTCEQVPWYDFWNEQECKEEISAVCGN